MEGCRESRRDADICSRPLPQDTLLPPCSTTAATTSTCAAGGGQSITPRQPKHRVIPSSPVSKSRWSASRPEEEPPNFGEGRRKRWDAGRQRLCPAFRSSSNALADTTGPTANQINPRLVRSSSPTTRHFEHTPAICQRATPEFLGCSCSAVGRTIPRCRCRAVQASCDRRTEHQRAQPTSDHCPRRHQHYRHCRPGTLRRH